MELAFEIEDAMYEAKALNSLLRAVTDSAYNSDYDLDYFETAFNHICNLADDHSKRLKQLMDEAFALLHNQQAQVPHMQAERM